MKYVGLYDNDKDIVTKEKLDAAVPTKTSQLENDSGFITSAPVTSVNTKTGAVELTASDVGAQDKITVEGILKGDGAGGISAAIPNVEYATCTKLLNGRAPGSLRTSGASAEDSTYTMGRNAFAQGNITKASGNHSHAEGSGTMATALMSHAEGVATIASGYASHTEGTGTIANHDSQHAQGQFNIADNSTADSTSRGNYAHIIGNGTSDTDRSNAHTLDWSGNAWFAGDVYVGSTSGTNKDNGSKKLATIDDVTYSSEGVAQSYSIYYTYSSGTIKGGDIALESPDILTELIYQSTSAWVAQNNYVGISRPVIIATFESEPSGEFNNKVLLSLNTVDAVTTTATFSGIYRNSANKMFLCEISFNFENHNISVGYTEISKSDTFIATIGTTSYNDVLTAFNAGKIIYAKDSSGNIYQLTADEDPGSVFSFINFYTTGSHGNSTYEVKGCILTSDGWHEDVTYSDLNAPQPSDSLPLVDGKAATGTSNKYARADHVHPIDTTRVPIARKINNKALTSDITLTADDVGAIPSTLTGADGQVLTKTADGQEWADTESDIFIATYRTTTFEEVKNAYNAGKTIFCKIDLTVGLNAKFQFLPLVDCMGDVSTGIEVFYFRTVAGLDSITANCSITGWSRQAAQQFDLVPDTRTINNKDLTANITLGHTYNATLASSGWTSGTGLFSQTLSVYDLVATYNAAPTIDLALDKVAAANKKSVADAWGKISGYMEANTAAHSITFTVYADTAPTVDIPIRITTYD